MGDSQLSVQDNKPYPSAMEIEDNYFLCEREWRQKNQYVQCYPRMITIETTMLCNLDCVMCDHGVEKKEGWGHFPRELVPALAKALPMARVVQLHGNGEPLMNPGFWDMLALTHEHQHVAINSNGVLVNKKNADALLDSAVSEVNFSLDAATEATYRKIRGADFSKVISNIRHFIEERNRRGKTRPAIFINMTLMRENIEEAADFVSLCKDLGADKAVMWHMNMIPEEKRWRVSRDNWEFDYHEQHLKQHPRLSNANIHAAEHRASELGVTLALDGTRALFYDEENEAAASGEQQPDNGDASSTESATGPKDCDFPWNWMFVKQNGNVLTCCFGSNRPLGNLHEAPAHEIWNRSDFRRLRKNAAANRIDDACAGGTCRFVQGRPSSDESEGKVALAAGRQFKDAYVAVKKRVRGMVGERAWAPMKAVFKKVSSAGVGLKENSQVAFSSAARSVKTFMDRSTITGMARPYDPKRPPTRADVIQAYRFILRREPENEEVVEHTLLRCASMEELLDVFINSVEFKNLQSR
ncbi:MAG: radical SAM protein [Nitrospinota bacterium]|nr:radical SAM protein [Nitrospinota bacterium]